MKKFIVGIILLTSLASCVEREEIIPEVKNEKTIKTQKIESLKKKDSIRPLLLPTYPEPGLDPGENDPGEVGPVVTIPPK
jgi:hypothetical protein